MEIQAEQKDLLKAILDPTDRWIAHFRAWEKKISIDHLAPLSFDLLPMLYPRLSNEGISTPLFAKLQGVYRYIWATNAKSYELFTQVLALTEKLQIPTLLIKGGALAFTHYSSGGERRMADFDLVVREEHLEPLLKALLSQGFRPQVDRPIEKTFLSPRYRRLEHGLALLHPEMRHIDLHWHVLDECCFQEADDFFWQRVIETTIRGFKTKTLNPTDHLFLVSVHGLQSHNLRWLIDAHLLLKKNGEEIQWERLYEKAIEWNLTLPLISAFSLLKEYGGHPLEEAILRLKRHPVSPHFAAEHRNRIQPPTRLLVFLVKHWFKHCRREKSTSFLHNSLTATRYLKDRFGVTNGAALGIEAMSYLRRRKRRMEAAEN